MIFGSLAWERSLGLFVQLGEMEQLLKSFTEKEEIQMKRILQRLDVLVKVRPISLTQQTLWAALCLGRASFLLSRYGVFDVITMLQWGVHTCFYFEIPACSSIRCPLDGGRRADLLPTSHQQTDAGDAEDLQQGEACYLQHVSVLPQGANPLTANTMWRRRPPTSAENIIRTQLIWGGWYCSTKKIRHLNWINFCSNPKLSLLPWSSEHEIS